MRFLITSLFAVFVLLPTAFADESKYSISASVFFGNPSVKEIRRNKNDVKNECVQKYLKAIPAGSFLLSAGLPSDQENALKYRRQNMEEHIVVMLGAGVRNEAQAFARALPLYLEWEGESEGPLAEADFVDNWLRRYPDTPIAPFLYLFKAHRLRAGFEAAKYGNEKGLWPVLAKRYKEALARVKSFHQPLIDCIADDMEAQDHVYLEGYGKP